MDITQKIDNDITVFGKEHYYYKPIFADKKQDYIYRNNNNIFIDYGKYTLETIYAELRLLQHLRKKTINGYILPNISKRELRLIKMSIIFEKRKNSDM